MWLELRHRERVLRVLAEHLPTHEVWAFGSRVHGDRLKPFSDLDLALPGDARLTDAARMRLTDAFADSDLPFRVDIVEQADVGTEFWARIAAHHEVLQHADTSHHQRALP